LARHQPSHKLQDLREHRLARRQKYRSTPHQCQIGSPPNMHPRGWLRKSLDRELRQQGFYIQIPVLKHPANELLLGWRKMALYAFSDDSVMHSRQLPTAGAQSASFLALQNFPLRHQRQPHYAAWQPAVLTVDSLRTICCPPPEPPTKTCAGKSPCGPAYRSTGCAAAIRARHPEKR
jgi:hypothetical protein